MAVTKESFLRDVTTHTVKVVQASGVHRHIHCRAADGSSNYCFDIVTWPGYLAISGDCGAYTFWRLNDMFQFFRSKHGEINASYWAEKVEAEDRSDRVQAWHPEGFKANVKEDFESQWEGVESPEARAQCWEEITDQIFTYADDENEAMRALSEFEHQMPDGSTYRFAEYWEMGAKDFTTRFLWCCRAIVWAIEQFDAMQPSAEVA